VARVRVLPPESGDGPEMLERGAEEDLHRAVA